ncbi:MAG: hypothetical protein IPK99_06830 [Flavobacteriales bacterium]|nr:hypothetical protein [Flavobacteriales bacterium]
MRSAAASPELTGLTSEEARSRARLSGANELPASEPKTLWRIAFEVMREPMFALLLACGIIYAILGDYQEGLSLLVAIFLIIGITFYQHQRSERALEALRDLSSPRALVIRDGVRRRIAGQRPAVGVSECSKEEASRPN